MLYVFATCKPTILKYMYMCHTAHTWYHIMMDRIIRLAYLALLMEKQKRALVTSTALVRDCSNDRTAAVHVEERFSDGAEHLRGEAGHHGDPPAAATAAATAAGVCRSDAGNSELRIQFHERAPHTHVLLHSPFLRLLKIRARRSTLLGQRVHLKSLLSLAWCTSSSRRPFASPIFTPPRSLYNSPLITLPAASARRCGYAGARTCDAATLTASDTNTRAPQSRSTTTPSYLH